jgi:LacI family transcriptional regulator
MARRPTIVDVAREAGVSKSTVSLVLQNSPLVKESTRARVGRAIEALGYVYNRSAANLRSSGVGLFGLVINDLRNPFFTEFAITAQMTLSQAGYAAVLANTDEDPGIQAQVVASMIEHGVSGLLISPAYGGTQATFDRVAAAGIPMMQVLRQADARTGRFPFASLDYAAGGAQATRHLIAAGARGIAFVGGVEERPITAERRSGYLEAMAEAGLAPRLIPGHPSRTFGRDTAERIAAEPGIDAALCFSDLVALGLSAGLSARGVAVGRDVLLVGFDDIEECALAHPALSSVRCDIAAFGRKAAGAMVCWMQEGRRPPERQRLPVELVVRESSGGDSA